MPKMTVDLRRHETLTIGEARVHLEHKSGQIARLVIEAPADTRIIPPRTRPAEPASRSTHQHGAYDA